MILCTECYIHRGNRVLLMYRTKKQNDINAGTWIGVGGKLMEGESPEECVRREAMEETGLELDELSLRGLVSFVYDHAQTVHVFLYTAQSAQGEPIECDEGDLAWIEEERMGDLEMWAGDRVFLERMKRPGFFEMKLEYEGGQLVKVTQR